MSEPIGIGLSAIACIFVSSAWKAFWSHSAIVPSAQTFRSVVCWTACGVSSKKVR